MKKKGKTAPIIISAFLLLILFSCGVWMLYTVISGTNSIPENYGTTQGYFSDYRLYSEGHYNPARKTHSSDTYQLIYRYTVDGQDYTVTTDSGTSFVPAIGSTREIRYDPVNPEEAVVVGYDDYTVFLWGGIFFTGGPLIFLLAFLSAKGCFKRLSIDLIGICIGLFFIAISYGALYMITGSLSIGGILEYFISSFSFVLLIPVLMILAGFAVIIRGLFFSRNKVEEDPGDTQ